jgi:hypothetical protein
MKVCRGIATPRFAGGATETVHSGGSQGLPEVSPQAASHPLSAPMGLGPALGAGPTSRPNRPRVATAPADRAPSAPPLPPPGPGGPPARHRSRGIAAARPAAAPAAGRATARRPSPGGAGLIRLFLARDHDPRQVPAAPTLQHWFHAAGLAPAPPGRRPAEPAWRTRSPHQVWPKDVSEPIPLQSGARVCWLGSVDQPTGAVRRTTGFPPRQLEPGGAPAGPGPVAPGFGPWGRPGRLGWTRGGRRARAATSRGSWRGGWSGGGGADPQPPAASGAPRGGGAVAGCGPGLVPAVGLRDGGAAAGAAGGIPRLGGGADWRPSRRGGIRGGGTTRGERRSSGPSAAPARTWGSSPWFGVGKGGISFIRTIGIIM